MFVITLLILEALMGGGGVKLTPLDFFALNFCSLIDCQSFGTTVPCL